jgi:hypothetical protein
VALRRFRAAGFAVAWLGVFCLTLWSDVERWLEVAKDSTAIQQTNYLSFSHSLISHWPLLARDFGLSQLAAWNPTFVSGGGMLVVALLVSWRVFQSSNHRAITWPYLLWLAAIATFVSPVAQDYNLLFIPLAILAICRRRDSWFSQVCVLLVLPWWQPLFLGLSGLPWFLLKLVSVILIGWLVVERVTPARPVNRTPTTGGAAV